MTIETFWLTLGLGAQTAFFLRFFVQWIQSERLGKSVVPISFWYLSIAGGAALLAYAIHRRDPVFIVGQSFGIVVYLRNLFLIHAEETSRNARSSTSDRSTGSDDERTDRTSPATPSRRTVSMDPIYTFAFKVRNVLAAAPLFYSFYSTRWEWEQAYVVWPVAISLCLAGAFLRGWARCHCNFARRKKKVLATTGPYAFSRNPLYIGNLLVIAGAGVASELAWFLPILLAWAFVVYNAAIRHEERRLIERYGDDYLEYRTQVAAWISLPRRADFRAVGFARVASLQVTYALLVLVPFIVKEVNPFSVWPHQ